MAEILDVSGLRCPLPVLRAAKALRGLAVGDVLTVRATDPITALDIPHFCQESGHHLLSMTEHAGELTFTIERGDRQEDAA